MNKYIRKTLSIVILSALVSSILCDPTTSTTLTATPTGSTTPIKKPTAVCGLNGNTDTICSPKTGDVWKNGTWYPITWNTLYPAYVSSPTLDIYIYFVKNYQNTLIKKISDVSTSKGTVAVLIDNTFRIDPLAAETYESLVFILSSEADPEKEFGNMFSDYPQPIHNFVEQPAILPISTSLPTNATISPSSTASASNSINTQHALFTPTPTISSGVLPADKDLLENGVKSNILQESHTIQPGIIAAIVLACLAVLGAFLAVFWVMRQSRKRKLVYGEKGNQGSHSDDGSMFPITGAANTDTLHHTNSSQEKLQIHNYSQNEGSISSLNKPGSQLHTSSAFSDYNSYPSVKLHGTSASACERGSLRSHAPPLTKDSSRHNFFQSTPSLPLEPRTNDVYMLAPDSSTRPQSTTSFSNISSRSEPPLTSTDALLIADTFRQKMRRPEWQQKKSEEEKEKERRQLGEDLLKKELEAEGTLMKKVGKRAHLLASSVANDNN